MNTIDKVEIPQINILKLGEWQGWSWQRILDALCTRKDKLSPNIQFETWSQTETKFKKYIIHCAVANALFLATWQFFLCCSTKLYTAAVAPSQTCYFSLEHSTELFCRTRSYAVASENKGPKRNDPEKAQHFSMSFPPQFRWVQFFIPNCDIWRLLFNCIGLNYVTNDEGVPPTKKTIKVFLPPAVF